MNTVQTDKRIHPGEIELADFLSHTLPKERHDAVEEHIASCDLCLEKVAAAHGAVMEFGSVGSDKKGKAKYVDIFKKINIYLILACVSFACSFMMPRYFIQFLVATLLLGIKWIVDAKSTKMLVMIYEAWKQGGEKEASRILETIDRSDKKRF